MPTPTRLVPKKLDPALVDPHLTALLMFIDNVSGDDDAGSTAKGYAALLAEVDALLTSGPLTLAFDGVLGRPSPGQSIQGEVQRQLVTRHEADDTNRDAELHQHVTNAETDDDYETISGERRDWQAILWRYSDVGMLYGACLMYRLLNGRSAR